MEAAFTNYQKLFTELKAYEDRRVPILMEGYQATPLQIVTAYMTREEGSYMRDYVLSPEGKVEALSFVGIHEEKPAQNPLVLPEHSME